MSKSPEIVVSESVFAPGIRTGFSLLNKEGLTPVEARLGAYRCPDIQVRGPISTFLNQRLVEIAKPTLDADWRIRRLQLFIDNPNGKIGWNLDQICGELGLGISGSHAARLFRRCFGVGVREYAKKNRLRIAAQRLKSTTHSVKEIALDLGYRTDWDFQRQFKQLLSMTPSEFRKVCDREQPIRTARGTGGGGPL